MIRSAGIFAAGLVFGSVIAFLALDRIDLVRLFAASMPVDVSTIPTKDLGRLLMGRVGERFVHSNGPVDAQDSAVFFDEPKPYAPSFCRINRYVIAAKIVRGGPIRPQEFFEDDLGVETLYAIATRPTADRLSDDALETFCKSFRDFDHLIHESTILTVERAVYVMDVASDQARSGKISFGLSCKDGRRLPDKVCDPVAILANFDLKQIQQVWMESETKGPDSYTRIDRIFAEPPSGSKGCPGGGQDTLAFDVEDIQHFGKQSMHQANVISIEVSFDCID